MKKNFAFLFVLLVMLAVPLGIQSQEEAESSEPMFVFPASLKVIEEETFSGMNIHRAVFQDKLERIEDHAFGDTEAAMDIYLPPSVKYIAEHAFSASSVVRIHGIEGSYAYHWAIEHQFVFVQENIWAVAFDFVRKNGNVWETVRLCQRIAGAFFVLVLAVGFVCKQKILRPRARVQMCPIDYCFP